MKKYLTESKDLNGILLNKKEKFGIFTKDLLLCSREDRKYGLEGHEGE